MQLGLQLKYEIRAMLHVSLTPAWRKTRIYGVNCRKCLSFIPKRDKPIGWYWKLNRCRRLPFHTKEVKSIGRDWQFNPISTRLFLHPICTWGVGGKFAPQSKNCFISDRCKIFCLLKLFLLNFWNKIFWGCNVAKTIMTSLKLANPYNSIQIFLNIVKYYYFSVWIFVISKTSLIKSPQIMT